MLKISALYIITAFAISLILAWVIIPKILVIAARHSLYDEIDARKVHNGSVPRLGGISFMPSIMFSLFFCLAIFYMFSPNMENSRFYPNISEISLFLCGIILLYLGGVKDDLAGLRYCYKFVIQLLSAGLVVFSGLYVNNLYGLFGIHQIPIFIGIPLTIVAIIFVINAINLIDGIDGLASSLSCLALLVYGTLFFLHGLWVYAVISVATIGVLVPFFYYNVFGNVRMRRKIFMGDAGSLTLGFILAFLALRYANYNPKLISPTDNTLIIAISPILVPMLDVLRVMFKRFKMHKNIFKADRNHIHHKLLDMGCRQSTALIILMFISSGFCLMNIILINFLNSTFILMIDILLWIGINMYFNRLIRQHASDNISTRMTVLQPDDVISVAQ